MMIEVDEELDRLVARHVDGELRGQLGRAAAAFEEHVQVQRMHRRARWIRIGVAGAIAASVAVFLIIHAVRRPAPLPGPNVKQVAAREAEPIELARSVAWDTVDEGTVLLDDHTPARKLRRQVVESIEWYDPQQGSIVEVMIPREQVLLVDLKTF